MTTFTELGEFMQQRCGKYHEVCEQIQRKFCFEFFFTFVCK